MITSIKTDSGKLKITLKIDQFKAEYEPPQIQSNYSRSGARYSARGLDQTESNSITTALKARVDQAKLTYEKS